MSAQEIYSTQLFPQVGPMMKPLALVFPVHLRAMCEDAREESWRIRLIMLRENRIVIGSVNLKGLPRKMAM
jgi:hypothetical protein